MLERIWVLELGIPRMGFQLHGLLTRFGESYFTFMNINFLTRILVMTKIDDVFKAFSLSPLYYELCHLLNATHLVASDGSNGQLL